MVPVSKEGCLCPLWGEKMIPALFELEPGLPRDEGGGVKYAAANARYLVYGLESGAGGAGGRLYAKRTGDHCGGLGCGEGEAGRGFEVSVPEGARGLCFLAISPWLEREGACLLVSQWDERLVVARLAEGGASSVIAEFPYPGDARLVLRSVGFPRGGGGPARFFCGTAGGAVIYLDASAHTLFAVHFMDGSVTQIVFEEEQETLLVSSTVRAAVLNVSRVLSGEIEVLPPASEGLCVGTPPLGDSENRSEDPAPLSQLVGTASPLVEGRVIGKKPRDNTLHGVQRYRAGIKLPAGPGAEEEVLSGAILAARPGKKMFVYDPAAGQVRLTGKYESGFPPVWTPVRRESEDSGIDEAETTPGGSPIPPSADFGLLYPLPECLQSHEAGEFSRNECIISVSDAMLCIVGVSSSRVLGAFELSGDASFWSYDEASGALVRCRGEQGVELFCVAVSGPRECLVVREDLGSASVNDGEADGKEDGGIVVSHGQLGGSGSERALDPLGGDLQAVDPLPSPPPLQERQGDQGGQNVEAQPVQVRYVRTIGLSELPPAVPLPLNAQRIDLVHRPSVFSKIEFRASPLLYFLSSSMPTPELLESRGLSVAMLSDSLSEESQAIILAGVAGSILRARNTAAILQAVKRLTPLSLLQVSVGEAGEGTALSMPPALQALLARVRTLGHSTRALLRRWAGIMPNLRSLLRKREAAGDFLCKDVTDLAGELVVLHTLAKLLDHCSYVGPALGLGRVLEAGVAAPEARHDELVGVEVFWCVPPRHITFLALLASRFTLRGWGRIRGQLDMETLRREGDSAAAGYFYPAQLLEAFRDTMCAAEKSRVQTPFMGILQGAVGKYWSGEGPAGFFDLFKSLRIVGREEGGEEELSKALRIVEEVRSLEENIYYTFVSIFLRDILHSVSGLNLGGALTGRLLRAIYCPSSNGEGDRMRDSTLLSLVVPAMLDVVKGTTKSDAERRSFLAQMVVEMFQLGNVGIAEDLGARGEQGGESADAEEGPLGALEKGDCPSVFDAGTDAPQPQLAAAGLLGSREFCLWVVLRGLAAAETPPGAVLLRSLCSSVYSGWGYSEYIRGAGLARLLREGAAEGPKSAREEIQETLVLFSGGPAVLRFLIACYCRVDLLDEVLALIEARPAAFLSIRDALFYTRILGRYLSLREAAGLLPRLLPLFAELSGSLDSECLRMAIIKGLEVHTPKYVYSDVFLRFRQSLGPRDCKEVSVRLMVSSRGGKSV